MSFVMKKNKDSLALFIVEFSVWWGVDGKKCPKKYLSNSPYLSLFHFSMADLRNNVKKDSKSLKYWKQKPLIVCMMCEALFIKKELYVLGIL